MKKLILNMLFIISMVACQKENNKLSTTANETIYVNSNNASMRVNIRGNLESKVIMIVIHGGPAGASYFYRTKIVEDKLEKKYAVAYWDQRVAGASQGGMNRETVVMEQYGNDLKKVIQTLKYKYGQDIQFFLMGQSWGGMVCSQFMVEGDNQNLVSGWMHVNAVHNWNLNDIYSRAKLLDFGNKQIAEGKRVDKWTEITNYCKENAGNITPEISAKLNFYSWEALNLIDGFTPFDEDKVIKENLIPQKIPYTNALFNFLNGSTSQLIKSLSDVEFSSKLSKITKPVIAMSGNYDFVVPEESAVEFINKVGSLKKSRKLFMKSGHNLEEQEAYVDAFIQFIDENK
jgi:pimeloyl-ACP methyl ester carboxylesterase